MIACQKPAWIGGQQGGDRRFASVGINCKYDLFLENYKNILVRTLHSANKISCHSLYWADLRRLMFNRFLARAACCVLSIQISCSLGSIILCKLNAFLYWNTSIYICCYRIHDRAVNTVLSKGFLLLVHTILFSFFISIQHNESNYCTAWFLQSLTVACSS